MSTTTQDDIVYKLLIVTPLVILLGVTAFPFFFVVFISFFNVRSYNLGSQWTFLGVQNYIAVLSDSENIRAILNTITYIVYALSIELILGILVALLLLHVNETYRLPLILPLMIPVMLAPIVVAMLWKQVLSYDGGLMNNMLSFIGIDSIVWLSPEPVFATHTQLQQSVNFSHGFFSLLLVEVWQWTPLFVAIFLITFKLIRREIIQSAIIDGASLLRVFWDVYLPMARPLLYGLILLRIMDMLKVYETIWVFFGNSISFANINIRLVEVGTEIRNYSYCAAFSVIVFLLIFVILFLGRQLVDRAGRLYYAD